MAGAITSLTGTVNLSVSWQATQTDAVYGNINNAIGRQAQLQFGTSNSTTPSNQLMVIRQSVSAGGTATIDLSTAKTNVVQNASATIVKVHAAMISLLTAAEAPGVGTACSGVHVGAAATNPINLFLGADDSTVELKTGEKICWIGSETNARTIDSTHKSLLITNDDGAVAAVVEITLVGKHS